MAKSKKDKLYWSSVGLYGMVLVVLLLYFRFPSQKFKEYCEGYIEFNIPEVSCTITKISYGFPSKILFKEVQLKDTKENESQLYFDPLMTATPSWRNPLSKFEVQSKAYGGSHNAQVRFNREGKSIELNELQIKEIDLAKLEVAHSKLDRKLSGYLAINGSATLSSEGFKLLTAKGGANIIKGALELKKPILQQDAMDLEESTVNFEVKDNKIDLKDGVVKSKKLNAEFNGDVALSQPLSAGAINFTGKIEPQTSLYREKKQLRAMVKRMQRKYKTPSLPFKIDGTIGSPTFNFGN